MSVYNFFGSNLYRGQKTLLITEGEMDAMSADLMLNGDTRQVTLLTLCCSMPTGANLKVFKDDKDFLMKFDRITVSLDQDDAGLRIAPEVASLLPDVKFMDISEKDANDMLLEGKQVEFVQSYGRAKSYRPDAIVDSSSVLELLSTPVPLGLTYPWDSLTDKTYGSVGHHIISIGSGPGAGKSSVVRAIQQHLMFDHGEKVGIFSLEDSTESALRYLVGYIMNSRIHIPGAVYDTEKAKEVGLSLKDKAYFFDNRFFTGEWAEIETVIRYMVSEGVRHFFIDPVSALAAHLDSSGANTFLNTIMIKMSRIVQELDIYIMLIHHLNNPTTGSSHDEGGRVLPSQFTGSKSAWRFSNELWGLERNVLSEDLEEKNTLTIRILKHRSDGSKTGLTIPLKYNVDTGRLEEKPVFAPCVRGVLKKEEPELFPPEPEKSVASPMLDDLEKKEAEEEVKTIANESSDSLSDLLGA